MWPTQTSCTTTPAKINMSLKKGPFGKTWIIFQPLILRGYVSLRESNFEGKSHPKWPATFASRLIPPPKMGGNEPDMTKPRNDPFPTGTRAERQALKESPFWSPRSRVMTPRTKTTILRATNSELLSVKLGHPKRNFIFQLHSFSGANRKLEFLVFHLLLCCLETITHIFSQMVV